MTSSDFIICEFYQWSIKTEIHFLPRYVPSEAEKSDAQLYADNVRQCMAEYAGVGLCNMTFQQIKEKYTKKVK